MAIEKFNLVSIDAWHDGDGWYWNQHYMVESGICFEVSALTPRKILGNLRKWGYLSVESKGRCSVDFSCDECIEIRDKNTGEPLLALTQLH